MDINFLLEKYFNFGTKEYVFYVKLNVEKVNTYGFTNKKFIYQNTIYSDIQSFGEFNPNLSKIVLHDDNYFYTIYLNAYTNLYFNDVLYLHKIGFLNKMNLPYEIISDLKGPIGFKMKKLRVIDDNYVSKLDMKTFYNEFFKLQKEFNILCADIHYTNFGVDETNQIFLFDIDSVIDMGLLENKKLSKLEYNCNKVINNISNIEFFWLIDRGYKFLEEINNTYSLNYENLIIKIKNTKVHYMK